MVPILYFIHVLLIWKEKDLRGCFTLINTIMNGMVSLTKGCLMIGALIFIGPGLLIMGITIPFAPVMTPTCNGHVMTQSEECQHYTNGTLTKTNGYQEELADEKGFQAWWPVFLLIGVIVTGCYIVFLTKNIQHMWNRRKGPLFFSKK
jgi:hypothetical protein